MGIEPIANSLSPVESVGLTLLEDLFWGGKRGVLRPSCGQICPSAKNLADGIDAKKWLGLGSIERNQPALLTLGCATGVRGTGQASSEKREPLGKQGAMGLAYCQKRAHREPSAPTRRAGHGAPQHRQHWTRHHVAVLPDRGELRARALILAACS